MRMIIALLMLITGVFAEAQVASFSYSGRLLDSNDMPVNQSFLTFQVRLRKGSCIFYQESIPVNLSNSGGYFTIDIGTGNFQQGQMSNLYMTGNILDINNQACTTTTSDVSYINIIVSGLTGGGIVDFGYVQLKNSYQGLNSAKLGGKSANEFITTTATVTQASIEALLGSGIVSGANLNVYTKSEVDSQLSGITASLGGYALTNLSNVSSIPASKITGQLAVSNIPDLSTTYATRSSLHAVATNGQYSSLAGRPTNLSQFTNDAGFVSSFSLPNIEWSKVISRPTTLDGYGITDSVKTVGGVYSFQSGTESSRPASTIAGSVYITTDTNKTFYYTGSGWILVGSGSVGVNVSAPLAISGGANPSISLPQASASQSGYLSNTDYTNFSNKISGSLPSGNIYVGSDLNQAVARPMSGDVTMNFLGTTSISRLLNQPLIPGLVAEGHTLRSNGTNWSSSFLTGADIRSGTNPVQTFFPLNCTAYETMVYDSLLDQMTCAPVLVDGSQLTFDNVPQNQVLASPVGADGTAVFRQLQVSDLPLITIDKIQASLVMDKGGVSGMGSGLISERPLPEDEDAGTVYISTDTQEIFRHNGTNWQSIVAPATSSTVVVNSPLVNSGTNTNANISLPQASGSQSGFLSSANWTTFNNKVNSVVASSPLSNVGTATNPQIQISQANASQNGYLSNSDWTVFNNKLGSALPTGNIFIGSGSGAATANPVSGDVNLSTGGVTTVTRIRGVNVSTSAPSSEYQVLKYSGSPWNEWQPGTLSIMDIRSTITPSMSFFAMNCTLPSQTWSYNPTLGIMMCSDISIDSSKVSGAVDQTNPQVISGDKSFTGLTRIDHSWGIVGNSGTASISLTSNTHRTSFNCSSGITLSGMTDGATYDILVEDMTTAQCDFSHAGLNFLYSPANGPRTSGSRTIYTMKRIGTTVYVNWVTGYQ